MMVSHTSHVLLCHLTAPACHLSCLQYVTLSFLGVFTFTAPYLPWVLLGFSLMLGSSIVVDLLGMAAGGRWACTVWGSVSGL